MSTKLIPQKTRMFSYLFVGALVWIFPALAQDVPIIRTHTTEIGGFVGGSYGIDKARIMGGGNIAYSLTRALMPFAEISYFPGIARTQPISGTNARATFSIPITDLNFGFHLRIPIPKSRVVPYGVISFGLIHSPKRTETVSYPSEFTPGRIVTIPDLPVPASTNYATSFGGGLRVYATERLGFRGEFKAYKSTGVFDNVFYRATGGFFFQF